MPINKNDHHARQDIGSDVFDAIPKSVFATLAYRLADRLAGGNNDRDAAFEIMREEIDVLALNNILPLDQAKRSVKALAL